VTVFTKATKTGSSKATTTNQTGLKPKGQEDHLASKASKAPQVDLAKAESLRAIDHAANLHSIVDDLIRGITFPITKKDDAIIHRFLDAYHAAITAAAVQGAYSWHVAVSAVHFATDALRIYHEDVAENTMQILASKAPGVAPLIQ